MWGEWGDSTSTARTVAERFAVTPPALHGSNWPLEKSTLLPAAVSPTKEDVAAIHL